MSAPRWDSVTGARNRDALAHADETMDSGQCMAAYAHLIGALSGYVDPAAWDAALANAVAYAADRSGTVVVT